MAFIGNTNTTQAFTPAVDYFSGNASTTAFTLSRPVASVAQVQVVVNNVAQNPSSAYTVSGNTITFTSAPSSGTNNIYVYYTSPITQVIAPGQGTVGTTQLQNGLTVNFADGTAAAPSITNDGDTNTGVFYPAADTVGVSTGGSERLRVDSSGNVGIGTSSPGNILDVRTANDALVNVQSTGTIQSAILNLVGRQASVDNTWSIVSTGNGLAGAQLRFTRGGWTGTPSMLIDSSSNLQFNSGYGSVATAYGCRAWVNFNGTGTVAIRASGNVTSITDNGVGDYTVNFTNAMPDANYSSVASCSPSAGPNQRVVVMNFAGQTNTISAPTSSACRFSTSALAATADVEYVHFAAFR